MLAMNRLSFSLVSVPLMLAPLMLCSKAAAAQEPDDTIDSTPQTASQPTSQEVITIEEIVVTAERSFYRLNVQIEYAKEKLYSVYNDLNELDEFDVDCRTSNWTHTRIQEQICWPVFFDRIVAENSQDSFNGLDLIMPVGHLKTQYQNKFDELRTNIAKVASENPEATAALMELGKLEEALRRKREECLEQPALLFFLRLCR